MQVTINANGTATIVTQNGSFTMPENLWALFANAHQPTAIVDIVKAAAELPQKYTNGYVRACVQNLAQPGQYNGSKCIGAINTSTQGKRVFVQVAEEVAPARAKLTRNGSNTPAAQAEQAPVEIAS